MSRPEKILVFGATSAIAFETLKLFARDGASVYLCSRDENDLQRIAGDLTVRGAGQVEYSRFDALDEQSIHNAVDRCLSLYTDLDGLLIAHGLLPDQKSCETSTDEMKKVIDINFTSAAIVLSRIALHFEKQKKGTIVAISSCAGDRGRESNYVYGSAKGALTIFMSGLRQRLSKAGVHVLTIKPGFVDTPMTSDYKKGILFVGPEVIAKGIYRAIISKKNEIYLPWFWWGIMKVIKNIPWKIYNKIKL
jgi:decaprenylphospho-beta-D-erythro-pentofuranosid-2-ulose 2-reductase